MMWRRVEDMQPETVPGLGGRVFVCARPARKIECAGWDCDDGYGPARQMRGCRVRRSLRPADEADAGQIRRTEEFYKTHPGAKTEDAPSAPMTSCRTARPGPMRDPVQDQHEPTVLFNGMLHPVIPYAIRGAIWYQGESIVGGKAGWHSIRM